MPELQVAPNRRVGRGRLVLQKMTRQKKQPCRMRFAVLFSGGKDSTFALWWALSQGWECKALVSILPKKDSFLYHWPNIGLVEPMARTMGIPLVKVKGSKDELADLRRALSGLKIDAVVAGAVASEYQRVRIEQVCHELGLKTFLPLWHKSPSLLWRELLNAGFKVMLTAVAADGLGPEWLGRLVTDKSLAELSSLSKKRRFHLAGEGGEFETLVIDCPLFAKELKVRQLEKIWDGSAGWLRLRPA